MIVFQELRTQLRENHRLRLGVWLILLVLVFYLALLLQDLNSDMQSQYQDYANKLHRLEEVADEQKWRERSQAAKNFWTDELKKIPIIESQGMAIAGVENRLRSMLPSIGTTKPQLKIDQFRAITNPPGIMQLTAKIDGAFVPQHFIPLLYDLEEMEQKGKVAELRITRDRRSEFELTYVLYFQAQ